MSCLAPKTELPSGLSNNTPGRVTNGSPTEVLPMVSGRARLVARWQTPVLHWLPRAGKAGDYWHFSCLGWLCLGPVDEIRRVWVGDKPGVAYADFDANRSDYPGTDYIEQTLASETPPTLRAYWGLETQANPAAWINGTVIRNPAHPMAGKPHPGYRGICYIILKDVFAGVSTETTPPLPKVEVEVYRRSVSAFDFGGIAWGAHPVGIVKDMLTAKRGGAKLPESYFDAAHWTAAMQRIMDVGVAGKTGTDLFISSVLDTARPVGEHVAEALAYIDGHIRERDGKLQIDWFPNDGSTANPAGLREISEHQRAGDLEIDSTDIEAMKTKVVVSGLDYLADPAFSEASEDEQVPYAVKFIGSQRPPESLSRPFYITRAQLKAYAKMQAVILATPQLKATVPVLRQYATQPDGLTPLRPGDRFNLDDQEKGLDLVVRIIERVEDGAKVIFKVVGERGAFPQPYQPPLDPRADLTKPPVADLARYTVAQLPPDLSDAADTVVAALIERASNDTQGFDLHFSPTNAWPGQVIASGNTRFAVAAVLQTAMVSGLADVTVNVNTVGNDWSYLRSQSILEQADDQLLAWHAGEWMSIGTITPLGGGSYSMSILRARLGSLPAAHALGVVLFIIPRADLIVLQHADFANVEAAGVYDAGVATKWFKARPLGAGGLQGNLTAAFSTTLRDPTPDVIADLTAVTGTGKIVQLRWTPNATALVNEYHVYRATGPGFADEVKIAEVGGSRFYDVTVTIGTQYRYRLKSIATDETDSPFSNAVTATPGVVSGGEVDSTPPSNPGNITLAGSGSYLSDDGTAFGYVQLNIPAMPAGAVGQNVLMRRNGTSGAWQVVAQIPNAVATVIRVDDLTPGTNYDFALEAFSFSGATSAIVVATGIPYGAPADGVAPAKVTGVVITALPGYNALRWNSNVEADLSEYAVRYNAVNNYATSTLLGENDGNFWDDGTVAPGATRYYWIEAVDRSENHGLPSDVVSIVASSEPVADVQPANPAPATITGYSHYLAHDGTVLARVEVSVPALPAGATRQELLYRRDVAGNYATDAIVKNPGGAETVPLDDVTPGQVYRLATRAWAANKASAIVEAIGSPFTVPGNTAAPPIFNGGVVGLTHNTPPKFTAAGVRRYGFTAYWYHDPLPADFSHFEVKITSTYAWPATPTTYSWDNGDGTPALYRTQEPFMHFYRDSAQTCHFFGRIVNTSRVAGPWFDVQNFILSANQTKPGGDMSEQNSTDVVVSALKTGGSGARKIRAIYQESVVLTLAGGGPLEDFAISISGRGFTAKPDNGFTPVCGATAIDFRLMGATYVFDHGSNSAFVAYVTVFMLDGSNLSAGLVRLSVEFVEYD